MNEFWLHILRMWFHSLSWLHLLKWWFCGYFLAFLWRLSHGVASVLLGGHASPRYLSISKRPGELKHALFEALGCLLQSQTLSKKLKNIEIFRFFAVWGKFVAYPPIRQSFTVLASKAQNMTKLTLIVYFRSLLNTFSISFDE